MECTADLFRTVYRYDPTTSGYEHLPSLRCQHHEMMDDHGNGFVWLIALEPGVVKDGDRIAIRTEQSDGKLVTIFDGVAIVSRDPWVDGHEYASFVALGVSPSESAVDPRIERATDEIS